MKTVVLAEKPDQKRKLQQAQLDDFVKLDNFTKSDNPLYIGDVWIISLM